MQTVKQTLGTENYEKLLDLLNLLEGLLPTSKIWTDRQIKH